MSGSSWYWRWRAHPGWAAWSAARCSISRPKAGSMRPAETRRTRRRDAAGDEDRRADCASAASPARSWAKPTPANGTRSTATAPRSAKRSRSPTICSTWKATPPRSARPSARTRRPTRRRWSAFWARRRRSGAWRRWWRRRKPHSRRSAVRPMCSRPQPALSRPAAHKGNRTPLGRGQCGGPLGRTTVPWPLMVQLGGLEPPTSGSTDRRSNQLSYSCTRYRRAVRDRRHPRIGGKL